MCDFSVNFQTHCHSLNKSTFLWNSWRDYFYSECLKLMSLLNIVQKTEVKLWDSIVPPFGTPGTGNWQTHTHAPNSFFHPQMRVSDATRTTRIREPAEGFKPKTSSCKQRASLCHIIVSHSKQLCWYVVYVTQLRIYLNFFF